MLSLLSGWSSRTAPVKSGQGENREAVDMEVPDKGMRSVKADVVEEAEGDIGQKDQNLADSPPPFQATEPAMEGDAEPSSTPVAEPLSTDPQTHSDLPASDSRPNIQPKRFSLRSLGFFYGQKTTSTSHTHKASITHIEEEKEREKVVEASKRSFLSSGAHNNLRKMPAGKQVQKSALAVQKLIVGTGSSGISPAGGKKAPPVTRTELKRIKSQLLQPKTANQVIAVLRDLPMPDGPTMSKGDATSPAAVTNAKLGGPIHAVCLQESDVEVDQRHFSKLKADNGSTNILDTIPSVANATLESLIPLFEDLHIVSLISAPDLGLGQPADKEGLLAGAVPTAEAVIDGAVKITPQLMALGFATGKAVMPDHAGVYPPLDRMTIITYWWGLELCIPHSSMKYLANADNISHTIINLLTALSLMNGGVREILPFIRYMSQFIDFEWNSIRAQDKGKGVVCAATWIMPAAMVPRPWDFPDKPKAEVRKHEFDGNALTPSAPLSQVPQGVPPMMLPEVVVTPPTLPKKREVPPLV